MSLDAWIGPMAAVDTSRSSPTARARASDGPRAPRLIGHDPANGTPVEFEVVDICQRQRSRERRIWPRAAWSGNLAGWPTILRRAMINSDQAATICRQWPVPWLHPRADISEH